MTQLTFPDILDSTLLAAYKSCPRKFWLEYVSHWKAKEPSVHLHAGSAFAKGLEVARNCFYSGIAETPVQETLLDNSWRLVWKKEACPPGDGPLAEALGMGGLLAYYGDFQCPEDSAKSATRMAGALEFYFDNYPLGQDGANPITLANGRRGIEISFAEPLDLLHPETGNPLLYCGRLDMAAEYAGGVFGEDDKTTSSLGASWSKQWDLRSQFTGYCWGLKRVGIPLNGFLVRGVSILKTKYDTQQAVTYRASWQIEEWYEAMTATVRDMLRDWESKYWRKVLDHACTDFGGCGFRQVCLSQEPQNWLDTYFVRRAWNPLTREEITL